MAEDQIDQLIAELNHDADNSERAALLMRQSASLLKTAEYNFAYGDIKLSTNAIKNLPTTGWEILVIEAFRFGCKKLAERRQAEAKEIYRNLIEPTEPAVEPDTMNFGVTNDAEAVEMIIAIFQVERDRQRAAEGYDDAHDDWHDEGELSVASWCYRSCVGEDMPPNWPFEEDFWKPTTRSRDLVKSGALLMAEKDRLGRLAKKGISEATVYNYVQVVFVTEPIGSCLIHINNALLATAREYATNCD